MGECLKIHSITLKEEYEGASENRDYHYDEEVLDYLRSFIKDNERKIKINKKRIDSAEDDPVLAKLVSAQFCILQSVFFQCFCIERMCCVVMNSLINKSYEYHYLIRHCSNPHLLLLFVIFYFNLFIAVFYTGPRDPRGSC